MITLDGLMSSFSGNTPQGGYTLADGTGVMPATATATPGNAALGVQAGQYGGQGMKMPAGSVPNGGISAGTASAISSGISGIADAITQYTNASNIPHQTAIPQWQTGAIKPVLASFPIAPVDQAAAKKPMYA